MKENNFSVSENINNLMEKFEKFIQSKTVVGEPIQIGDVTIVPLLSATFGLGSGGGDGESVKGEKGIGGGSGIAAKISPLAILVIKDGKPEIMSLKNSQTFDKLVDLIPDIISKIKDSHPEKTNLEKE